MPREPEPSAGQTFLTNGLGQHPEQQTLTIDRVHGYQQPHDTWTVRSGMKQYEIFHTDTGWKESDVRGYLSTGG